MSREVALSVVSGVIDYTNCCREVGNSIVTEKGKIVLRVTSSVTVDPFKFKLGRWSLMLVDGWLGETGWLTHLSNPWFHRHKFISFSEVVVVAEFVVVKSCAGIFLLELLDLSLYFSFLFCLSLLLLDLS